MPKKIITRNSNVELLRINAMALVVLNHFCQQGAGMAFCFPFNVPFYLISHLGGLGDVLFFGITAYYAAISSSSLNIKQRIKKIWLLERQLLWSSSVLLLLTLIIRINGVGFSSVDRAYLTELSIKSVLPLCRSLWWYPSAYAVFVLLQPSLNRLLKTVGPSCHRNLSVLLFAIYSVTPAKGINLLGWTPLLFIYLYILITYIVWYENPTPTILVGGLIVGLLVGLVSVTIAGLLNDDTAFVYLNYPQSFFSVVTGITVLLLVIHREKGRTKLINMIASKMFGVYLLLCYPTVELCAAKMIHALDAFAGGDWFLCFGLELIGAAAMMLSGVMFDSLRQAVFALTIDTHRGRLFESLWLWLKCRFSCDLSVDH